MPRILSDAQLAGFRERGYAFPVRALSRQEALAVRDRFVAVDAGDRAAACGSRRHRLWRFKVHLLFPWVAAVVRNARLLDAVEDVLGPDILLWASGMFPKPAGSGDAVPWHQDHIHAGLDDPARAVRVWCALGPASRTAGTLRLLPGSHRSGDVPHVDAVAGGRLDMRGARVAGRVDDAAAVDVEIGPGELSLHDLRLLHASGPNATGELRLALAMTFMTPEVRPLSGRDSAMLVRGRDRCGHWELETHRPAADFEPAAVRAHARAMALRNRNFYRGAATLPPGVSFDVAASAV